MMIRPRADLATVVERLRAGGFAAPSANPKLEWFGDGPELARELGNLVRRGLKRASASLLAAWHADGDPLPQPGDVEIVIDWSGEPLAVVEVTEVRVLPFDQVDAAFARDEGEGDGSLAAWREAHWDYLSRECARVGQEPALTMPVMCRRFRLLNSC